LSLERIIAAARTPAGKNGAGHSELYEWFWARYDELVPNLAPPRTPNWSRIAEEFATLAERGEPVRDGGGQAPKAITCRQTWGKVVRGKELIKNGNPLPRRQKNVTLPEPPAPTLSNISPARMPVSELPHEADPDDEGSDGFVLQLAGGPKTWTPKKETDDV